MAYTALYRKFRPTTFDEMVGQEHITRTIKNQILAGRVGHAYLFNGGRGTGKTSIAKIMARAVNCLNPQNGEPCNECEICKAALAGSLTDIVEMDAASNNSVDDIRAIRDEVNFLPAVAKYRVYIIDEVHMLSTGAFNALLKTLEEPPEHVKFILATTEPQKIPATILSRCQRFDFKRISVDDIIKRLKIITKEINVKITDQALKLIAILAEGALRDAISILDRCIQDGEDEITEDKIRDLVGIPKQFYVSGLAKSIIEKNSNEVINIINTIIKEGKDLDYFIWEIIEYINDVLVYKVTGNIEIYSDEEKEEIKKIAEIIEKEKCLQLIYNLSELASTMKWSTNKNIVFEAGILKECMQNEDKIKEPDVEIKNKQEIEPVKIEKQEKSEEPKITEKSNQEQKTTSQNVKTDSLPYWKNVLEKIKQNGKMVVYTNLIGTKAVQLNDMTIGIEFKNKITDFTKKVLEEHENRELLRKLVSIEAGQDMQIKLLSEGETANFAKESKKLENMVQDLDIPFNIIDE